MSQFFQPSAPPNPALMNRLNQMAAALASLQQKVYAMEAAERLRSLGKTPRARIEFRAQYAEDAVLWDLFDGQTEGFFIEVGAFDGYNFSVTYAFETIGWTGLLIEPIPERFEQCRARRTASRVVHGALTAPGGPESLEFVVTDDMFGGMLSHVRGAPGTVAQEAAKLQRRYITTPCTTMDALLEGHSGPIDFAVLDVEGAEVDLLKGFDLARWRPRVLLIEDNEQDARSTLKPYMAPQPYAEIMRVGVNRLYIRSDESELIERAKWIRA